MEAVAENSPHGARRVLQSQRPGGSCWTSGERGATDGGRDSCQNVKPSGRRDGTTGVPPERLAHPLPPVRRPQPLLRDIYGTPVFGLQTTKAVLKTRFSWTKVPPGRALVQIELLEHLARLANELCSPLGIRGAPACRPPAGRRAGRHGRPPPRPRRRSRRHRGTRRRASSEASSSSRSAPRWTRRSRCSNSRAPSSTPSSSRSARAFAALPGAGRLEHGRRRVGQVELRLGEASATRRSLRRAVASGSSRRSTRSSRPPDTRASARASLSESPGARSASSSRITRPQPPERH